MNAKKYLAVLLIITIAITSVFAQAQAENAADKPALIGISKLMPHPALDAIEQGIMDYIATTDLKVTYNLQSANGEVTQAAAIAQIFKDAKTDVNVAIATPTAQAIANTITNVPLVYATVTDPVAAGLVGEGMEFVCGTSDMVPVAAHLETMRMIKDIKNLGMVYTSGEANGVAIMELMKAECQKAGINFVPASITNTSEARQATLSIIDRVDYIYVANDNTVISAISAVADVCRDHKVPLFTADTTSSYGTNVLMAGGFDYYASGVLTGTLIEKVLRGEKPEDIGIVYLDLDSLEIYLNMDIAKEIGVEIPAEIYEKAAIIFENGVQVR